MCDYHFTGQSKKYRYLLDENSQASIIDKKTGEVITEPERVKKIFSALATAFMPPEKLPDKPKVKRHKFGIHGRVLLSDAELQRLYDDLGEKEVNQCISYVDESAEMTNNKNKWSNWNLVIRKCQREQWHKQSQRRAPKGANNDLTTESYDIYEFQKKADELPVYKRRADT